MTLFLVQVCKIRGFYEFTRLIVSLTYKALFSSGCKFLLVRYLKKKTTRIDIFQQTLIRIWTLEKINILPCRLQICYFNFAPNFSYHYCSLNRSAFTEYEVKIWFNEMKQKKNLICNWWLWNWLQRGHFRTTTVYMVRCA